MTVWRVIWVGSCLYLLGPTIHMAVIAGGLLAVWCIAKWLPIVIGSQPMECDGRAGAPNKLVLLLGAPNNFAVLRGAPNTAVPNRRRE